MSDLFIGLMSGTSCDGIDAALVSFASQQPQLLATHYQSYPGHLRSQLLAAAEAKQDDLHFVATLDATLGDLLAQACKQVLSNAKLSPDQIDAIGSHGHTLRHSPTTELKYTVQIGDPSRIAAQTGIPTIADFRRADMSAGGQGAPLAPGFHTAYLASPTEQRAVVNIGGIANVTLLVAGGNGVSGFDTGPGNCLLDAWFTRNCDGQMDQGGEWASTGKADGKLLQHLLSEAYFSAKPPKSTGRELFNLDWLDAKLHGIHVSPQDVQATLCELTAQTIHSGIVDYHPETEKILVCGGGVHNDFLMQRISDLANGITIESTLNHGIDPDWVEAMAFAWLARQRLLGLAGNLPAVTGAVRPVCLGAIHAPN